MGETIQNKTGIIIVYDGWLILVDDNQWTLAKDGGEVWKRTKKSRYRAKGYYASLRAALKACYEEMSVQNYRMARTRLLRLSPSSRRSRSDWSSSSRTISRISED